MSIPFFDKFNEKTKDFYKADKYDLGQTVEILNTCCNDLKIKTKFSSVGSEETKSKFSFTLKRDFGSVEINEDLQKGLSVEVKLPNFYKSIDLVSKHSNKDVEVTAKYNPQNSYWNTKLVGYYNPKDKNNQRVCRGTASFAVGDDGLKLNVGGQLVIEDKSSIDKNANNANGPTTKISTYSLGFLYNPTNDTSFSVIYSPDKQSNGLEYSFGCYKKMSAECTLSAKAEGKVDTKLTAYPPTIYFGGGWTVGSNFLQGFLNSRKEWGLAYKVKVNDAATVNLGVASFIGENGGVSTKFGYKLSV